MEPNPTKCVFKWEPKFVTMPFNNENTLIMKIRDLPPSTSENENGNDNEQIKTSEQSSSTDNLPATEVAYSLLLH